MPTLTIHQRLDALLPALQSERLLTNRGIGNEIGFYIFDYEPEHEPLVQQYLPHLKQQLFSPPSQLNVLEINLYHTILDILKERQLLQTAFKLEADQGSATLAKTVKPLIRSEQIVKYIQIRYEEDKWDLVLMTGVGASWPLLRSHTILNSLHPVLDRIPLVMFFPGFYDGNEMRLFNILRDDNYYRAFPLIPRPNRT